MADLLVTILDDGVMTLTPSRPNAINSLNLEMLQTASEPLTSWAHDNSTREMVLRGGGTRGLSAGADVRELSQAVSDGRPWLRFLEVEYLLDLIVVQFPRHITAHLNDIIMGGGLGLTVNIDRRIVGSSTLMAMPEMEIGFFPGVGVMCWLARAEVLDTHMALTSGTIGGGNALHINLADKSADGDLPTPLSEAVWTQECYTGDDSVGVVRRPEEHPDPVVQQASHELRACSPLSVHVAPWALRRVATLDLNEVLHRDLRLAEHMISVDFVGGVCALPIDKDNQPAWCYATLEDVPTQIVDEVFSY